MMAFRAADHESIGLSPNMRMSGRNTKTPLDVIYKMPPNVKHEPANLWVWELQERLESVHKFVRETTGSAIASKRKFMLKSYPMRILMLMTGFWCTFPLRKQDRHISLLPFGGDPFRS